MYRCFSRYFTTYIDTYKKRLYEYQEHTFWRVNKILHMYSVQKLDRNINFIDITNKFCSENLPNSSGTNEDPCIPRFRYTVELKGSNIFGTMEFCSRHR